MESSVQMFVNSQLEMYCKKSDPIIILTLRRRTTYIYVALWRSLTLRRLMSYIYGAPILDVSRSHTTTQHSR